MLLKTYFSKTSSSAPLAVFRMFFGFLMFFSVVRFWLKGWIEKLYIEPTFFFSYYGFEWIKPLGNFTYGIFVICGISSLLVALGYKYRIAIVSLFLSFTYIEMMDKTTYLNHYYFTSALSFLLIFLPAHKHFSLDSYLKKESFEKVPTWTIDSIKLLLSIVYFYAGLAKLNSDWMLRAMPLKIWLPSKYDIPIIGNEILQQEWVHYAMSWGGALYDLAIPFLLWNKRTRAVAFALVIFFHIFTRVLFPIGMFPYIMIIATLIFFDAGFHKKIIDFFNRILNLPTQVIHISPTYKYPSKSKSIVKIILMIFFTIQMLFPWRYLLYPGELFWTEEGYRFSWRVMLMEKVGYTTFKIVNNETNESFYVENEQFLTEFQIKQMSFQPDFILEYAHYLGGHFKEEGLKNISVYADSYVALNGRTSKKFIDSQVDLLQEKESFRHKTWILSFDKTIPIKGI